MPIAYVIAPDMAHEVKAEPLKANQLELLVSGNTLHLQIGDTSQAAIYFGMQGNVRAKMGNGTFDTGKWSIKSADTYCITWEKGPKNSCSTVSWLPGEIRISDAEGKPRGKVLRVTIGEDVTQSDSGTAPSRTAAIAA